MTRPVAILVLLLALLAGCGGSDTLSTDEYSQAFDRATQQLSVAEQLFRTPSDRQAQLQVLRETETRLRTVADDLDALKPPASLAEENTALVAAIRHNADVVGQVADAYAKGEDLQELAPQAQQAVQRMVDAVDAVRAALAAAG